MHRVDVPMIIMCEVLCQNAMKDTWQSWPM